jgi:hypothetical protein
MKVSNVLFLIWGGLLCLGVLLWRILTFGAGHAFMRRGLGVGGRGYCSYPVYSKKSVW